MLSFIINKKITTLKRQPKQLQKKEENYLDFLVNE